MEEVTSFMKYQTISSNKEEIEPLKENEDEPVVDVNNNHVNSSSNNTNKPISTTELYTTITTATTKQIDNSLSSSKTSLSSQQTYMCRICHCEETSEDYLITPCHCTGTLRYVHQACLQQWLKSNGMKSCELCKFEFIMQTKIRPFKEWQKLDMSRIEKRKIMCSVAFHVIAITCVVWSLYVLIDRTAEEIRKGLLGQWPFWTKIVVVAIGFTGGVVFMYIQCKMYLQLCIRWKQYNRVIIIQPINEDLLKKSKN